MILTAVTNEVLPQTTPGSLDNVFKVAADSGVTTFEVRTVEGKRFPMVEPDAWEQLKAANNRYGIKFSAVSPGLFKAGLSSNLISAHEDHLLPMSLDLGEKLDVSTLIVFAPMRDASENDADFNRVVDLLGRTVDSASARGFSVQLENLPGSWADTSEACYKLLKAIDRSSLGYVWDTGNLFEAEGGRHFQTGYDLLKPFIKNVQLKDGSIIDGKMVWQPYGAGETDIKGQVEALKADNFVGTLVLEAACNPHKNDDFERSLTYLKSIL